ncbi:kinase domain protein (macronuclear) [Tetrahymena thermophila SB210]|uniref:Kinase domain protein n=1 Tax=Tetrahymena thermophila (strain SB210) TaxID=312017 RepID=Q23KJ1_TETTS|nr:kinase domain protein [Tetrahymena thermophila SB210]EAR96852.2 kinase domain protein [Tetrahymena thermophila SB210]|eukprot:XP_001017097.2 kinase domain protein [Tetrahymena thermophila SB210]
MQKSYNLFKDKYGSKGDIEFTQSYNKKDLSKPSHDVIELDLSNIKSNRIRIEDALKQQEKKQNVQSKKRILSDDYVGSHDIAIKHSLAIKVGRPSLTVPELCPCCLRKIDEPLNWNFEPEDIGFLGVGYPQFYTFLKYQIYIVFAIIISSSSFNILSNALLGCDCLPDDMIDEYDPEAAEVCQLSWSTYFSMANKRNLPQIMSLQQVLNFFTIFTIIILLFKARIKFYLLTQNVSTLFCPSAYTIFIQNIPNDLEGLQGKSIERYTADVIQQVFGVQPISVNVCWNLKEIQEIESEKDKQIFQLQQIIDNLPENELYKVRQLREEIQKLKEEKFQQGFLIKKRLSLNLTEENLIKYFTGKVFVVFSRVEERDLVIQKFAEINQSENKLFLGDYYDNSVDPPALYKNNEQKQNKGVKITKAVPPNEIIWENTQYSHSFVQKRKIIFWFVSVLCMLVCYSSIGGMLQLQRMFQTSKLGLLHNGLWVQSFAILVSLVVYVLNTILRYLLSYFNQKTYFTLRTDASTNMAGKLAIAYFLNSGIMSFIIDVIVPRFTKENGIQAARVAIYRTGGLIYNMQYIFVMNAIIIPLMQLIDVSRIFQLYYQWQTDKKLKDYARSNFTQKQLNDIYSDPASDLVYDYALIISQMYFMAFYSPLIPMGSATTLFTLVLFYLIHKFKLAKHRSLLNNVGSELCVEMTEMLELIVPIYCFSNLIFEHMLSQDNITSTFAIIGVVIGILNAVLPMDKLKDMVLDNSMNEFYIKKPLYQEIKDKFETDYDIENPVTKDTYVAFVQDSNRNQNVYDKKLIQNDKKAFKNFGHIQNEL